MLPNVGWPEMLMIMVFALVVFGPKRLPEIARQIGKAIREVRKMSGQFEQEVRSGLALDDDFPYMKGPAASTPAAAVPPVAATAPDVAPPVPPPAPPAQAPAEPGVVRYGEI